MTELWQCYGIARETGYVWLRRYREGGLAGLVELNRAALRHGKQTPAETEQAVLELRQAHQRWPAASTIGELVKREGLVVGRKQRRRTAPYTAPLAHADGPNRVWCADFKGWFRSGDGERIDPLTMTDAYSRYLQRCQAVEKTDTQRTRAIFEAAFREYGMPQAIRPDNGAPFASSAIGGLSRLAVWWMKLGIVPERIEAGHPEQNGRHERMHRTLKQETANRRAQQRAFDRFRTQRWGCKLRRCCTSRRRGSIRRACWCAGCIIRARSVGKSAMWSSARCCGESASACCRSMSAGLRFTSRSLPSPVSTAGSCEGCPRRKITISPMQGKGKHWSAPQK